jgi:Asp/Glu/hydantoin racemase
MGRIALVHASRAAVDLVTRYYSQAAPELEITNLLDDGVLRLLESGEPERARQRLREMLAAARGTYGAEAALLTCSAVPLPMLAELRREAGITVLKIDEAMCDAAVRAGSRVGLLVSFLPASSTTQAQLAASAERIGTTIEIVEEQAPEALRALLAGDEATHEELLIAAADRLAGRNPDLIVLAQVSMSRLAPRLTARLGLPVFSSLASSLETMRSILLNKGSFAGQPARQMASGAV